MRKSPPKLARRFLLSFLRGDLAEEVLGDLDEKFYWMVKNKSLVRAKLNYCYQVFNYLRPFALGKMLLTTNYQAMLRHNFIISFRNFRRYKTSFVINLIGLSTGLACALLIYLWVTDELSVDKFHEKDEQLYQVMVNYQFPDGIDIWEHTPSPLAAALAEEMPEVNYAVSVNSFFDWFKGEGIISYENSEVKAKGIFASSDYFDVFSYKLIRGEKDRVLADKNGIVISEGLAMKLFNTTEDIVGRVLEWNHRMRFEGPLYVTGVFENLPANSTSQFDIIFNYQKLVEGDRYSDEWNATYAETYLVLKKGTDIDNFGNKITGFLLSKHPFWDKSTLFVRKYSEKYLYNHYENGIQAGGRIEYVRLFSVIAVFILVIACINFMNLSTAQASRKMTEVGIKKAMGINRNALVVQFLVESITMAFLSLAIAILLIVLLLPQFNVIANKHLHLNLDLVPFLSIAGIVLFTGFLSGCYPAFYLSSFNPVAVLKGKLATSFGEQWVRKGLVIVQFTASAVLIVCFFIVNKQIEFTQTRDLGYNRDNVVSFERQGRIDPNDYDAFVYEIKKIPGVVNASSMFGSILNNIGNHTGFVWEGQVPGEEEMVFWSPWVSHDFIETLGIQLKEGRTFSSEYANEESAVILNEAAVRAMGLQDPVGKTIQYGLEEKLIVGVVMDFHYGSLHSKVDPVIFMYARRRGDMVVRLEAGKEQTVLWHLEAVYEKFHPGYPFEFTFLDDDYRALYESENRVSVLSTYFAGLAIIISCLGLFGLAAFTAERRIKEIGIRKILGSSVIDIVRMLTGDITKPVVAGVIISGPISYLIAKHWLSSFAYRIDLSWWFFVGAGLLALLVAWLTVVLQTIKAALMNPADSLRSE